MNEIIKQNRADLQEEFQRAKTIRDIKRGLEKSGTDISLDMIKIVVEEYLRLTSNPSSVEDPQEIVIDWDTVRSKISDDDDAT